MTPIRNGSHGVPCPLCGAANSNVKDGRPVKKDGTFRRRRECVECHARFTTYEQIDRTILPDYEPPAPPTLEEAFTILAKAIRQ